MGRSSPLRRFPPRSLSAAQRGGGDEERESERERERRGGRSRPRCKQRYLGHAARGRAFPFPPLVPCLSHSLSLSLILPLCLSYCFSRTFSLFYYPLLTPPLPLSLTLSRHHLLLLSYPPSCPPFGLAWLPLSLFSSSHSSLAPPGFRPERPSKISLAPPAPSPPLPLFSIPPHSSPGFRPG